MNNDILTHDDNAANIYCLLLVACPPLDAPNNGIISCSPEVDELPSPGDTCTFSCNTGYRLTGSHARICQDDQSWNGSDPICRRGE